MKQLILILLALILPGMNAELSAAGQKEKPTESMTVFPDISPVKPEGRKLQIVASISVIGDVASHLVGERADIKVLMGREQSPHAYDPSPQDVISLEEADLILVNGFGLEENLLPVVEGIKNVPVLPVFLGGAHMGDNPHTWFSPLSVMTWVDNIERALILLDPKSRDEYEKAAKDYKQGLVDLDRDVKTMVSKVPSDQRKLVTDHAFMNYYAKDYGFKIVGTLLESDSDHAEPSPRALTELVDKIKSENIRAFFVGEEVNSDVTKLAEAVAQEAGRNLSIVQILSDSLAPKGNRGDSYFDFIRYNTEQITSALSGK